MRSSMIAFCVLLALSVLHVAPAAPVAAGEPREVRSNPVELNKDGIVAAREKRMDPNNKDQSPTNDVHLHLRDDDSGNTYTEEHASPAPDVEKRGYTWRLRDDDSDPGDGCAYATPAADVEKRGYTWRLRDDDSGDDCNGYAAPVEKRGYTWRLRDDDSGDGYSEEHASPAPDVEKRGHTWPGPPMSELQGTVDSNAYVSDPSLLQTTQVTNILTLIPMFRARAISASSEHDLPVRRQGILDKLD
jgi:hypothetical protein